MPIFKATLTVLVSFLKSIWQAFSSIFRFFFGSFHYAPPTWLGFFAKPLSAQDTLMSSQNQFFSNYKGLSSYSKSVEQNSKRQYAFAIVGIPCVVGGLIVLGAAFTLSTANSANGDNNLATTGAMIGGTLITTGLTFEIVSIVNGIKKKKGLKK